MRVSVMWGANYLFLLETARGVITQSRGEQVRPFARWEPRKHFENLREKNHGESNPVNTRAVDESTMMDLTELIVKPAISPFAPTPEQADMPKILHQSDWEESAQELPARRVLQATTTTDTGTCDEGESFAVTSTLLSEVVGCYDSTGTEINGEVFYTETGEVGAGQNIVQAFEVEVESEIRWIVAFEASSSTTTMEKNALYCFSSGLAADAHPGDVESWFCFTNGEDEPEILSTEEFSTSCGCSSTSEPSTLSPSPFVGVTSSPSPASDDTMSSTGPTAVPRGMMPSARPSAALSMRPTIMDTTSVPTPLSPASSPTTLPTTSPTTLPTTSSRSLETTSPTSPPSSTSPQTSPTSQVTSSPTPSSSAPSTAPSTNFGHRSITLSTSVTVGVGFVATVVHLVGL